MTGTIRRALPAVNLPGLLTALGILVVWQLAVVLGLIQFIFLPAPTAILGALPGLIASPDFAGEFGHTLWFTVSGWITGSVIGLVAGSILGLSRVVRDWSMTSITVIRLIPAIALLPIAALIFGLSSDLEFAIVSYVSIWPVLVSVAGGIANMEPLRHDVGRTLHLGRLHQVVSVVLPSAVTPILVGLRLSLTSALVLAIVTEMVGNPAGLGNSLNLARNAMQPELTFCYIVIIGITAVVLNGAFQGITRLVASRSTGSSKAVTA